MTHIEYKLWQAEQCLKELMSIISNDAAWLTQDDKRAIEAKADELRRAIAERYRSHA